MSDSLRPHRRQPTRLHRPWDSPGKNTGVGCHFLLQCMKVKSESQVAQSCQLLATPWAAPTRLLHPWDFSRQEYWSGVPFSSPEDELRRHQKDTKNFAVQPRVPCLCSYILSQDGEWMWCRGSSLRKVTLGGDWGRGTEEVSGQAK